MAPEREEDVKVGRCGLVVCFFYGKKKMEICSKCTQKMMFLKLSTKFNLSHLVGPRSSLTCSTS